ncbi:hypothetical protein D3C87_1934290 [compost metagenome]
MRADIDDTAAAGMPIALQAGSPPTPVWFLAIPASLPIQALTFHFLTKSAAIAPE